MKISRILGGIALVLGVGLVGSRTVTILGQAVSKTVEIPTFQYDPDWPKALPNNWITGNIGAVYIEPKTDHIWVAQRPNSTTGLAERFGLEGQALCCFPAPPVMEFDTAGNLVQAWGPVHINDPHKPPVKTVDTGNVVQSMYRPQMLVGTQPPISYDLEAWPVSEHGIFVDHDGNVWVDSQSAPSSVVKMSRDGKKLLLRIGKREAASSNDTENMAGPTGMYVDPASNEVFVADGYRNRRVIVFDATTGAYKRHWGAYGKPPTDPQAVETNQVNDDRAKGQGSKYTPESRRQQFDHVHCLTHGNDGLLYVCDRANNRIQVFRKDGTLVKEGFVAPATTAFGSVLAIAFSPDKEQRYMYVADGPNHCVWILNRETLETLGSFGRGGRRGGEFVLAHAIAVDSKGNVYVGETVDGNRIQKFTFMGMRRSTVSQ